MLKTIAAALIAVGAMSTSAQAQVWGFGVEIGPRYYDEPPVVLRQIEPRVFHMEAPEDVLEELEDAGFRELSPMRRRGRFYTLHAVDPNGNLVALDISIFTGEIERTRMLKAALQEPPKIRRPRRSAPVAAPRPAPQAPAAVPEAEARVSPAPPAPSAGGSPSTLRDRLQTEPEPAGEEGDPLVVY